MNVLIIEDEQPAARRLQKLLEEVDASIIVLDIIDSIEASVKWLNNHHFPELIFMDIQLADGLSFEIFKQVKVTTPVIFTTAFDEYSLRAFKVNSIDYLLKPMDKDQLENSLKKYKDLKSQFSKFEFPIESLFQSLKYSKEFKSRFLVKLGERLISISTEKIAYFLSEEKLTFLITNENKKYPIDYSLDELEPLIDPKQFFRLNRQLLAQISSIQSIHNYFNGKLKLFLAPDLNKEVVVSREKATLFKQWLEK